MCIVNRTFVDLFMLQSKKSDKPDKSAKAGTGRKPEKAVKMAQPSNAVNATPGAGRSRASDNASDTLFAGLADNRMLQ